MKKWFWFTIAVGATAVLLVAVLGAIFVFPVRTALASALAGNGPISWADWRGGPGFSLPPAFQGLASIPADQRFDHFSGAQINLTDQNGQPMRINLIPGKVSGVSATNLSIAANNGSTQSFTLNDQTIIRSRAAAPATTGTPTTPVPSGLQEGDPVVVVTLGDSHTATAVIGAGPSGFGRPRPGAWWGKSSQGQ